jgi:hypothetical protein
MNKLSLAGIVLVGVGLLFIVLYLVVAFIISIKYEGAETRPKWGLMGLSALHIILGFALLILGLN